MQSFIVLTLYRIRPSNCRTNDFDPRTLMNRYIELVQSLCKYASIEKCIRRLVEEEPQAQEVRGILKLRTGKFRAKNFKSFRINSILSNYAHVQILY